MGKKILVIEDNAQDRKILQRFLNEAGFTELLFAERGEEGIQKVSSEKPDLIILDTMLPDMNGFEVCRRIKQENKSTLPKIIIVTGLVDAVDAVKAREAGADDYSVKTSDFVPLIGAIRKLI